jgi:hypothetical protein
MTRREYLKKQYVNDQGMKLLGVHYRGPWHLAERLDLRDGNGTKVAKGKLQGSSKPGTTTGNEAPPNRPKKYQGMAPRMGDSVAAK